MRVATILSVSLGLALTAGCGRGTDSRRDDGSRPVPPALAGPLVYERGGGLSGSTNRVRLEPDGRATFTAEAIGERTVDLRPAELEEVERALDRVDLAKLPAKFVPAEPTPDTFVHEVTYQARRSSRRIPPMCRTS